MKELLKMVIPPRFKEALRKYKLNKNEITYKGNKVTCSICNSSYKEFGPFGLKKRKNALCFKCGSLERHRLVWKYLNDKNLLKKPLSILHFAPEKVFYDIFSKSRDIEYFPCDLMPENYNYSDGTKIIKADITDIPFESNCFDFILCSHVLEHIPDDNLAMSELFRVMKNGGFGIFQVPIDYSREKTYEDFSITNPKEREKAFGQHDHVRWYGKDYINRLEKVGFQVTEDDYVITFSEVEQFKYGFMNSEKIYYCKKVVA